MDAIDPPEVPLLERLRLAKGVSAGQVVVATGVTHKTLRRYEREPTYYPNAVTVCKLADYYGVSAAEIVRSGAREGGAGGSRCRGIACARPVNCS
jgi:transcriptional regulator with XRE-family HTH domain